MRHNREEVIERTIREFKLLDRLVAKLTNQDWKRLLPRPETKEPWTVKDALAHITHFKADIIRSINGQHKPSDVRGLNITDENHVIYMRWRDRTPREVLAWHRQVQKDVLTALRAAPEEWFSGKDHKPEWPFDLDGHSACHRVKDIEQALATTAHRIGRKNSKSG
ncbi:MAG: maleylpyruvate isomerase N-terminal domain-containing protein [Chloroflexi bacterium]|nr:maleylpyruvate isomerase N-terminal domain-containing protein [Chloroflexota bacterium]